jgi:predicted Co/Zn/Cd cation transporter (cation efflux family)
MAATTLQIVLGGRTFAVSQQPIRADGTWRRRVKPLVDPVAEMAMAAGIAKPTPDALVKLAFTSALFVDPLEVSAAVCSYAPELAAEQEWIENNAYANEALEALLTLFFGMRATPPANGAAQKLHATT